MKTTKIISLFVVTFNTSSLFAGGLSAPLPAFMSKDQLATWRQSHKSNNIAKSKENREFYTGRPFLKEESTFLFKFRSYNPELNRWTSVDQYGFPDGPNNYKYLKDPNNSVDYLGAFSLSTTTPTPSSTTGPVNEAAAWALLSCAAGSSSIGAALVAGCLQSDYGIAAAYSSSALSGNVTVSGFGVQNQTQAGLSSGASVALTLTFNSPPAGFAWLQIQRMKPTTNGQYTAWHMDVSSMPGPAYRPGPIMQDQADVGQFSQIGAERELYTFAAIKSGTQWTIYDGVYWGGEIYE